MRRRLAGTAPDGGAGRHISVQHRNALLRFWARVEEHFFAEEHGALDYADFIEYASAARLLKAVPYDPVKHQGPGAGDMTEGDDWYIPRWSR